MDIEYYLLSLGLIPLLMSRGILPVLASALVARFGPDIGFLAERNGIEIMAGLPEWLQSDASLIVLAVLAFFEHRINRSPELSETLSIGDAEMKGIFATALCLLMVFGAPSEVMASGVVVSQAGLFSFATLWALMIGVAVWVAATARRGIYGLYAEMDPDDSLGIRKLLAGLESFFAALGPFIFVIFPLLAAVAAGFAVVALKLLERGFAGLDAKHRYRCECGVETHLCAIACGSCGVANPTPRGVGVFGQPRSKAARQDASHVQALREKKRCARCAEKLKKASFDVSCDRCRQAAFENVGAAEDYLLRVKRKLPATLLVSTLCSLIPVVGLIPGVIYYRLNLISGLRAYLPWSQAIWSRWLVRFACLLLVLLQALPLVGALSIPIMCLINYGVYAAAARRQCARRLAAGSRDLRNEP
ncbi:MAG: hypothetical protein V3W41_17410 [Planctomycetota bacterium]